MQQQPPPKRTASLAFVYFGVAFTIATALSMAALTFARPWFEGMSRPFLMGMMLAPPVIGAIYGARVATLGTRHDLRLGQALKRGLGL